MDGDAYSDGKRGEWEAKRELAGLSNRQQLRASMVLESLRRVKITLQEIGLVTAAFDVTEAIHALTRRDNTESGAR